MGLAGLFIDFFPRLNQDSTWLSDIEFVDDTIIMLIKTHTVGHFLNDIW